MKELPANNAFTLSRVVAPLTRYLNYVAAGFVFICMLLTTADVVGRYLRYPVPASLELTEVFMAVIVWLTMGWLVVTGEHISIEIITARLPRKVQAVLRTVNTFLLLGLWSVVAWQSYLNAIGDKSKVTDTLKMPVLPFTLLVPIGAILICLALLSSLSQKRASK